MAERVVERAGVRLSVSDDGEATEGRPPVVLLHGLTATRRYVVMGSTALSRSGHRVVAYDARGHGTSGRAPVPEAYDYADLGADLEAVLDAMEIDRAVLAGASMGAHTLLWLALHRPERVAGGVVITPAYEGPEANEDPVRLAGWDALADGLRDGGIDGFLAALDVSRLPERWRGTALTVARQRMSGHADPSAIVDALRAVPRSLPFGDLVELRAVSAPVTVVASDDAADPGHPFAVGEAYARIIPGARLVADEPGHSPVAWQGSQLSRVIAEVVRRAS